ncbi:spore coat polysaccharide biosynthesis protein SpsF [Brevinema andersonii]|uniref:Spore coat polysaccharide biosynthesis protein SpsF n=1 Tax=Brevinema andersonii TaxID=34097 RepID=A0A1I1DHJ3_BREAD|nr:hypothetical protein [Brevinema andersonii]SFB74327.1 spore coat polysaccharide biosynthesis protein SpsF [Brevinema andersonii]
MEIFAGIQARLGSKRFPGKIFAPLIGKPILTHVIQRVQAMKNIKNHALLVPDREIETFHDFIKKEKLDIQVFGGSELDVLKRYVDAARYFCVQNPIMRVTADNPLLSVFLANQLIDLFDETMDLAHFLGNPLGTGVEIVTPKALLSAHKNATSSTDKEHVTQYIYKNRQIFRVFEPQIQLSIPYDFVSVDTSQDLERVEKILAMNPEWGIKDFKL